MTLPDVVAIDVLLEPDDGMLAASEANNARLRAKFPDGFALDEQHRPHITLLQCFVAKGDLEALYRDVGAVLEAAGLDRLEMRAVRYGYTPGPGMGIAGIWAEASPALVKLQADVIAAARSHMVATAGIGAFTADHGNPAFDAALIDYVTHFTVKGAGANFEPHVSTGVAPTAYLDAMVAEPFEAFGFKAASAAVYQLGPFGTAAKLLKRWAVS